jgi:Tol biopolymer transport system component
VFGLALSAAAADPPAERADGLIGYSVQRTDLPGGQHPNRVTGRAFVVKADGTGTRQLAPELTVKRNQSVGFAGWSPDGRQAILSQGWESPENGLWEHEHRTFRFTAEHWLLDIVLCDIDDGKLINLTAVERVSFYNAGLVFLPNQPNRLGFLALVDGQQRPFAMDRDGKNKKPLSEGAGFIYGFQVSPDGKRICYHKDYQVYTADADGSNARPIKNGHPFQFCPLWSPTGEWLTFLSGEHYDCHPHLIRADGTGLKKLADRGGYRGVVEGLDEPDFHSAHSDIPAWSPDGRWLYYTAKVGAAVELMRVRPEGQIEQLTRSKAGVLHYFPQVSPDSKWVAFGSNRTGVRQLYVARADGSDVYPITNVPAGWRAFHPHWRPKH